MSHGHTRAHRTQSGRGTKLNQSFATRIKASPSGGPSARLATCLKVTDQAGGRVPAADVLDDLTFASVDASVPREFALDASSDLSGSTFWKLGRQWIDGFGRPGGPEAETRRLPERVRADRGRIAYQGMARASPTATPLALRLLPEIPP